MFGNCRIIGKRFPIVHVYADGICLEVSSFGTRARREIIPPDAAAFLPRHKSHEKVHPYSHYAVRGTRALAAAFMHAQVTGSRPDTTMQYPHALHGSYRVVLQSLKQPT